MTVWTLETSNDFTPFCFLLEDDRLFFKEFAKEYFEKFKPASEMWHPLFMMREEPMKHPDFFEIDSSDVIAISQNAANALQPFIEQIELLPIETDAGRYYALNVINFVDCLNKKESKYEATKNGRIVKYSLLEFDEEKLKENKIFKIPEMPYCTFVTDDFQEQCEEANLRGLVFDTESNLIWYPE